MTWPEVAIGEIFDVARGGSPRPIDRFITDDPDGLNWVMIGDATSSGKVIESTKKRIRPEGLKKTRAVKPGDFILSNSMSFGRPYIMGIEGCIHDGWLLLRPRDANVDPDYFYHLLGSQTVYAKFASRAAGATVKNLNSDIVRNVSIPVPPLEEQRRIAGILDQADALRRLRTRMLDKLSTLGQAIFHEMSSQLDVGEETSLTQIADVQVGHPFKSKNYVEDESGVRLCRGANVLPGRIDWSNTARYPSDLLTELRQFELQAGDLVLAMDRPWISSGFKVASIGERDLPSFLVQRVARFRAKRSEDQAFLKVLIGGQLFQAHCRPTETTVPHISPRDIKKFRFPLPAREMRAEFGNRMRLLEEMQRVFSAYVHQAEALFDSLQHRAFRGEL